MALSVEQARKILTEHGQDHVLRFWDTLDGESRSHLLDQIGTIDFPTMARLIGHWVLNHPAPERFSRIDPIPLIPKVDPRRPDAIEAHEAGEAALRAGRVAVFLVAGGQGSRLGFDGPKGAYPIGPISGKSFFAFHAEKIRNLQRRYECVFPWYIMTSDANDAATREFFREHAFFGLAAEDVHFLKQRMAPCVDDEGRFMLDQPGSLAMNPNGHGGCLPAMVENGVITHARGRGVDILCYFQVDNWAARIIDPYFIGYHVLRRADMSSKNVIKRHVREAVGVHCLCDGEYRVIEYSELDIYPQLLEIGPDGKMVHPAGNPAIHILSVDFVEWVCRHLDRFPWHRAHKRIVHVDASGRRVRPEHPNGYKFETFVFDALRFVRHAPVALEIDRPGEYTPVKQFKGENSVVAAWECMAAYWAQWFEAAGHSVPRDGQGKVLVRIEVSPEYAFSQEEFVARAAGRAFPQGADLGLAPDGALIVCTPPPCRSGL